MRIKNTLPDEKPTRRLYDEETMGAVYDPPGIEFDEADGTVAQIRQEVADAVVEKYDHFVFVEQDADSEESADSDDDEDETDAE